MFRQNLNALALVAALTAATGCQDLIVANENDPDRDDALSDATAVELLMVGSFAKYYSETNSDGTGRGLLLVYGTEFEGATDVNAVTAEAAEPRVFHSNLESIANASGPWAPRIFYGEMYEAYAVANDALRVTAGPNRVVLVDDDDRDMNPRARAFSFITKGLVLGQLANMYDQAIGFEWNDDFPTTAEAVVDLGYLRPSEEILELALAQLDSAKAILTDNIATCGAAPAPVCIAYPAQDDTDGGGGESRWFESPAGGGSLSATKVIEFINTQQARMIIMNARNPAERAALNQAGRDWNDVLALTQAGLTSDFDVQLTSGRNNGMLTRLQRYTSNGGWGGLAIDNRLIGQADTTGAYQAWIAQTDLDLRVKFDIGTPDRRLVGLPADSVTFSAVKYEPLGAYVRYNLTQNCCLLAGAYRESSYQWRRKAHESSQFGINSNTTASNTGTWHVSTVDENNLYMAEAYYHLGMLPEARDLVNITRTRDRNMPTGAVLAGLPAATVDGAPHSGGLDNCVPRTDAGDCGDLLVALRYERMIELMGYNITRGYLDSRGFGLLPDDSWTELPLPAPELVQFSVPLYGKGGVDDPTAAVYAPVGGANPTP